MMRVKIDLLTLSQGVGTISQRELEESPGYPIKKYRDRRPVAVIECTEEIPCNPCETVCKRGAIVVGEPITNLPRIDPEMCDGCGLCIPICPGLAVFLVDNTYSEDEGTISFPYEYLPMPHEGDLIEAVNREGEVVCNGKVIKIRNPKSYDHTAVITIAVPKKYIDEVRGIKRVEKV